MRASELIRHLNDGGLEKYASLYQDVNAQKDRMIKAINEFTANYGDLLL